MPRLVFSAILLFCFGLMEAKAQPVIVWNEPLEFCHGDSVTLCVEPEYSSYLWNNGATTQCTTVTEAGDYSVLLLDAQGNLDSTFVDSTVSVVVHGLEDIIVFGNWDSLYVSNTQPNWTYQWYFNGMAIPGGTDYLTSPNNYGTGNYMVQVTDAWGCSMNSDNYEATIACYFGPMGIEERGKIRARIFPNPASDNCQITVEEKGLKNLELSVFNVNGKRVLSRVMKSSDLNSFDTAIWPNGIYLVSLTDESGRIHSEKLMVQH